jgi:hypothetical protein
VGAEHHVLRDRHGAEQRQVLEGTADAERGNAVPRRLQQRATVEQDRTLVARINATQNIEQRRLAGTVRSDEAQDLAAPNVEGNALQCHDAAETHRDTLNAENWSGNRGCARAITHHADRLGH